MIRDAILDALAVLAPVDCAGCGGDGRAVCRACRELLLPNIVRRAGQNGLPIHTSLIYEGAVRRVVLAFKEQGRTDAASVLSHALSAAVAAALSAARGAEVAAVPPSRASYRRRGYDPVRVLLRRAGVHHARVLARGRGTAVQKALTVTERSENLRGAFVATRHLHGRRFVVVDDVLTSGATLAEAARAISAAGGDVVGAATMAFTPRLLPVRDIAAGEDYGGSKGA